MNNDSSCMAYLVSNQEETDPTYTLYIQGEDKVYLSSGSSLFQSFSKLTTIEGMEYVDTSQVRDMYAMFAECYSLASLDVSNFDTSQVTDMRGMFSYCINLVSLDVRNFDTSQVTDMGIMFWGCISLVNLDLNVNHFDTSQVTDMSGMFYLCINLTNLNFRNASFTKVENYTDMFDNTSSTIQVIVKDATAQSWMQNALDTEGNGGTAVITS